MGMDEEDIKRLFREAAGYESQRPEDVQRVFSILVSASLRYRDHVMESTGEVVTVEHVRTALKWLIPALAIGQPPETENEISLGLLKIWVEELAKMGYPKVYFE